jgi:hypothetical protein
MSEPLLPHNMSRAFRELSASGAAVSGTVNLRLAEATEMRAKEKLNAQSHKYGTPTTASQGGPPAKISGDLMRSVTHEPTGPAALLLVGPADLPHRRYPPKTQSRGGTRKAPANDNQIGEYLEVDLGYPWLGPSADEIMEAAEPIVAAVLDSLLKW